MREIKFRAWDKRTGEWMHDYKVLGGFSLYGETIVMGEWLRDVKLEEFDMIEVMQYTGLKDKNGVEIYEGDVVEYPDPWKVETVLLRDSVTMNRFPLFWLEHEEFGYEGEELISIPNAEVIGNIYENPELL